MRAKTFTPTARVSLAGTLWLGAEAMLECTLCEREASVKGAEYLLSDEKVDDPHSHSLSSAMTMIVSSLAKRRDCEGCGMTSIIPESGRAELAKMAEEQMTEEWAESRKRELYK